jgi:hypothetical protein
VAYSLATSFEAADRTSRLLYQDILQQQTDPELAVTSTAEATLTAVLAGSPELVWLF